LCKYCVTQGNQCGCCGNYSGIGYCRDPLCLAHDVACLLPALIDIVAQLAKRVVLIKLYNMKLDKILCHLSWLSASYFLFLAINHYILKSRFFLIGGTTRIDYFSADARPINLGGIFLYYLEKKQFQNL